MIRFHSIRTVMPAMVVLAAMTAVSFAGVFVSVAVAPPPLPVYAQPPCPGDGYMWTPGYWAYGPDGYYWVPGTWVMAPTVGYLWTPGYWGFASGLYVWHPGYWGPHVGFYGGINYGFGYTGVGFAGGMWIGGRYHYNTAVTNVNTTVVRNVYVNRTVVNNVTVNRTSFNGTGGIATRPTRDEIAAGRERHLDATAVQASHERDASRDRSQFVSVNHGRPGRTAMNQPGSWGQTRTENPRTMPAEHRDNHGAGGHGNGRPERQERPEHGNPDHPHRG